VVTSLWRNLLELQRHTAYADAVLVKLSDFVKHYLIFHCAGRGAAYGWFYFIKDPRPAGFSGIRRPHQITDLGPSPIRFASPGSRARWLRWSAAGANPGGYCKSSPKRWATWSWKGDQDRRNDIERGREHCRRLGEASGIPHHDLRMVTAGEQTGKIDSMLERISDFLDEEIETTLSGLRH